MDEELLHISSCLRDAPQTTPLPSHGPPLLSHRGQEILKATSLLPREAPFLQRGQQTERVLIKLLLSRLVNSSVLHSSPDAQKLSELIKGIWEFSFNRDN